MHLRKKCAKKLNNLVPQISKKKLSDLDLPCELGISV
jgi:hypothetical protein